MCKETQTEVVWSCLPFISSGQNHLARHIERGKKTRQTERETGRQHQRMDRPGVHQVPEGSGEQRKMEETGGEVICGAPTTLVVKGQLKAKAFYSFPWQVIIIAGDLDVCFLTLVICTCDSCLMLLTPFGFISLMFT